MRSSHLLALLTSLALTAPGTASARRSAISLTALAEAGTGVGVAGGAVGPVAEATLGFGYGIRTRGSSGVGFGNTALRFYFLGSVSWSGLGADGQLREVPVGYAEARSYTDLGGGLRLELSIWRLGLAFELLGGTSYVMQSLRRDGLPTLASEGWSDYVAVGWGVQYRLTRLLSLDLRGRVVLTDDPTADLRRALGITDGRRLSFCAGVTWHI